MIIIYESVYGNTKKVAEAIAEGIRQTGNVDCKVAKTSEVHTEDLVDYDIILFGCPNHNQEPARNMTKFIERVAIVNLEGKIGAAFDTFTGGNKGIALSKLEAFIQMYLHGFELKIDGLSIEVADRKGPPVEGATSDAKEYGKKISKILT
ncbi:MAG: flavodoxin domain-containing protein [Candidatus Thorarchaeota archaeon]